jgi:hypothetical protein
MAHQVHTIHDTRNYRLNSVFQNRTLPAAMAAAAPLPASGIYQEPLQSVSSMTQWSQRHRPHHSLAGRLVDQ